MSWKWDLIQVKDEIEDIAEAKTSTKRRHSRSQLDGRVKNLRQAIRANEMGAQEALVALLFAELGQAVLDNSISAQEAFRLAGRWKEEGLPEELAAWGLENSQAYRDALAPRIHAAARETVSARTILTAIRNLQTQLERYAAQGASTSTRAAQVQQMRQVLAVPLVTVSAGASTPVPGVTAAEWRQFQLLVNRAKARISEWESSRPQVGLLAQAKPFTVQENTMPNFMQVVSVTIDPTALASGALSLAIQRYRKDPSARSALEEQLTRAGNTLASLPTGSAGTIRLNEIIGQAEALLSPVSEAEPLDIAPQVQTTTTTTTTTGATDWLLVGGAVVGLLGVAAATAIIVKKARAKKAKGAS